MRPARKERAAFTPNPPDRPDRAADVLVRWDFDAVDPDVDSEYNMVRGALGRRATGRRGLTTRWPGTRRQRGGRSSLSSGSSIMAGHDNW